MDSFPYCAAPSGTRNSKRRRRGCSQINASQASPSGAAATPRRSRRVGLGGLPPAHTALPVPTACLKLPPTKRCSMCGALKFAYEPPNFCCGGGRVVLAQTSYPAPLVRLLTSTDEDAVHFRRYIRMYNSLFAFTSLGGHFEGSTVKGIYVFKLHGQIYHNIPSLLPNEDSPKFLQLYFYDGQHENERRTNTFAETRADIIDILMTMTESNPYARFFRSLRDINVNENTQIIINTNPVLDQRVYNAPTSDEVAVIWTESTSSSESGGPHIVVTGKDNETRSIKHYHGCYDPLQYPILFPNGECGWARGLPKQETGAMVPDTVEAADIPPEVAAINCTMGETAGGPSESYFGTEPADPLTADDLLFEESTNCDHSETGSHISVREYYCYKLQKRPNNLLLRAGRCLQQYIVDMYVKVENARLDYFRYNQSKIRAELYQGILDTFEAGENCAANVGRRVILPPTFLGGPRDMKKRYLNAMSLVQKFGKPDFFLTVTCNPAWPEIKTQLEPGEEAQNRPDLVARVFRAKLLALKKKIMDEEIFGKVAALIYVVEFQKRGLPHAHFLIILESASKLKSTADFDKFVCAEIPTVDEPHLRTIILKHMMHGPCGRMNPQSQCMHDCKSRGKCKSGYPKQFNDTTTNSEEGYPLYRRRDDGQTAVIRKFSLDNRWVVPYNPYLSALFDCHLNVEVCSTIQAVKYLYKYVYKGHDRVSFNVVDNNQAVAVDEIQQYQSGRWVSPCEAAWRIFRFNLFEIHPPVMPLPIHLPNSQSVQLHPHECLGAILADPKRAKTPLTEFFRENLAATSPQQLYGDFTDTHCWDKSLKRWRPRKKNNRMVARLAFVAPGEGERFYLRLLLLHVRGPTSFEDLLTVDGYQCTSFQESAVRRRLLEEDDAVNLCLQEACTVQMPAALRRLFATILTLCQPSEPATLWTRYLEDLSTDYRHKYPQNNAKVLKCTLRDVEQYLEAMGKSLAAYGLDAFVEPENDEIRRSRDIIDALEAPIPQQCIDCRELLNTGQQRAFDMIMTRVREQKPGAFFVDGPGGTGKTFLYNALYAEVRLSGQIVLPTATSGIAASNIPSGRTAHSRFKIPIDLELSRACDVAKQGSLAALIKETKLIIWDEASMARRENVESLDALLRDLCNKHVLFGGKVVVFGGDFRQILPVVPNKSAVEVVEASLVCSSLWPQFTKLSLTENIRARADPGFAEFLLSLGNGMLQNADQSDVLLPSEILTEIDSDLSVAIPRVARTTFPEMFSGVFGPEIFTTRAILTPMNEDVDIINAALIEQFPGTPVTYKSFDTMIDDTCNIYPSEFINKLCPGGMTPHDLILKENCPVILLRNLLPAFGLCNGTRLICHKFHPNLLECIIACGQNKGEHVFIPRINLRSPTGTKYPFQFQRKQFPVKLSFAMTINRSQGQTLERVSIFLPRPCFSPGQLYVALSRARQASRVNVFSVTASDSPSAGRVRNIVSSDVLRLAGIV